MTTFTLKFDCDNAAFDDDIDGEIVRILRSVAARIECAGLSGFFETIRDVNGNDVGRYALKNADGSNYSGHLTAANFNQ